MPEDLGQQLASVTNTARDEIQGGAAEAPEYVQGGPVSLPNHAPFQASAELAVSVAVSESATQVAHPIGGR